jgi:Domain of unknown function (DUF4147)
VTASGEFEALHAEAKGIFFGALKACDIASSLDLRIQFDGDLLHRLAADGSRSSTIDLSRFEDIFVVALGKAAGPMLDALLNRMKRRTGLRGIYCSNQPPKERYRHFQFFEGGHPVPNEDSFAAARAALTLLKTARKDTLIFFLIFRRRVRDVRAATEPEDHVGRDNCVSSTAARVGGAYQRGEHLTKTLFRCKGWTVDDGCTGSHQG